MKKTLPILYLVCTTFLFAQNTGIYTTLPQTTLHVDPAKNNNAVAPTATTVKDDFSVTSEGRVGIGTVTPRSSMEIMVNDNSATATTLEGLLIPQFTRDRVKAMIGVTDGTLVFVYDATGYVTDSTPGSAINIDAPGFYYFGGAASGQSNVWSKFEVTDTKPSGQESGLTLNKIKFIGEVQNTTTEQLACGKYKFRINNTSGTYTVQWALRDGTTYNGTINISFRDMFAGNSFYYRNVSRVFNNTTADNTFANITAGFTIGPNDIFDIYLTYPGDTDFYKITIIRIENGPGVDDNYNMLTCSRF